ncbi:3-hydroxyacyl-CoA dehydrogenase [Actinoallomurus iriomotensis]|uniref:3-hydroxyacyl-CoA dehydrogenase n=1 Tax=Actinoallomurus iriomotensis TaxID=478107 RepID=A0A9W6VP82_9ACTN|nr:3-hydroxyacyl-CoA dehydrogenase [Actinoallomurus iriomotensis]GLY75455.1 3-hydroxyacyl-CoA dehydrogenase [Actinoallomurus iriomotensis]
MSDVSSPAVTVVGAGSIGVAWAIVFARAGHRVALYDLDPGRVAAARPEVERRLAELAGFGLADEAALDLVTATADLGEALAATAYVQECVVESLEVKRELFAELDRRTGPEVVLASSTSMIPCSRFADALPGRARCLVVHPGNPPYLLPIAELAPAPFTAPETVERARELLSAAGMVPVLVGRENEGFIFNRLQGALLREAYCLVRDGVATPADVDLVVNSGLGRRWSVLGPFATAELNTRGGIERHAEVLGPAYARMGAERGQHDPWTPDLVARVAAEVHATLPPEDWADHVERRDRALMRLEQARRADPESFGGFSPSS